MTIIAFESTQSLASLNPYTRVTGLASFLSITETMGVAMVAVRQVKVTYKDVEAPIISIKDAIAEASYHDKPDLHQAGDAYSNIKILFVTYTKR